MAKLKTKSGPKKKRTAKKAAYRHLEARTEKEQTRDLSEEILEAWTRLRSVLVGLGEQEIRTSHRAIMFARKTCYLFVRPKRHHLEACFFLREALDSALIKKSAPVTKTKFAYTVLIRHVDQIEAPLTDWIRAAYAQSG